MSEEKKLPPSETKDTKESAVGSRAGSAGTVTGTSSPPSAETELRIPGEHGYSVIGLQSAVALKTPTPDTDAAVESMRPFNGVVSDEFARQLERERDTARRELFVERCNPSAQSSARCTDEVEAWQAMQACDLCRGAGPFSSCVHYLEFTRSLRSANESTIKDAARYRWLRDGEQGQAFITSKELRGQLVGDYDVDLDKAVDEYISASADRGTNKEE
jgi:hypothetical protein